MTTEGHFLNSKKPFLCGVCEGFYGKPWTFGQRQELFTRMQRFGMNVYLYAPKDDYKHRLYWRDLYTEEEAAELRCLIREAEERNVTFIYAISPGLDIIYSSSVDVSVLKKKLDQVKGHGCQSFALLFDDIEDELCSEDITKFASIADAQCFLTNDIYNHLNQPDLFLFCPTEYCSSRSLPDVPKSTYLKTVGLRLDPRIEFLWTGPKVVSRQITAENVTEVGEVVRRQVTVWDNLHANDYDQTRLYLGPYSGRPTELLNCLRGVLTNPNCEFEANFIALHTLAQWSCNSVTTFPSERPVTVSSPMHGEADMEVEEEEVVESTNEREGNGSMPSTKLGNSNELVGYEPRKALQTAVADWLPELYKTKSPFGQQLGSKLGTILSNPEAGVKHADEMGTVRSMDEYYEEKVHDVDLECESAGKDTEEDLKKIDEDVPMVADDDGQQGVVGEEMVNRRDEEYIDDEKLKSTLLEGDPVEAMPTPFNGLNKQVTAGIGTGYQTQQTVSSVVGGFYYDYRKRQHDTALTGEEVIMICDFFYLPFEHGPMGEEMLKAATWLVDNFDIVYRTTPFHCYSSVGQRLASFLPHLSDSLSPYSSSPPDSPISDRTTSPPPPPPPLLLLQSNVVANTTQPATTKPKPDKSVVFVNASLSTSTTLVGSTVIPTAGRFAKNRFLHDTYLGTPSASEWYERAIRFHDGYGDLSAVVDKLVNIPNRELLYELYKYVNDMRSNLALVNSYIKWHGIDKREKELFKSGEQEPWVHRGGLLAEFRRLLPFDRESTPGRNSNTYFVRPYYPKDRSDVNSVCLRTYNDTLDASYWLGSMPNLVGDCKIGAFLQYFSKFCYVLEDDLGVCGYVVAADNVRDYRNHLEKSWLPEMRFKYPTIEADKKNATTPMTTVVTESTATLSEESREETDAPPQPGKGTEEQVGQGEETDKQDGGKVEATKDDGPCPMSSSEHSRSASPANDCPTFSVFGSLGANRLKSQTLSIEALLKALHSDHKPVMKEDNSLFVKYPSPISIGLLYGKGAAAKVLLASAEQALANAGSQGIHVILPASHKASIDMYKRLGFKEEKIETAEVGASKMEDSGKNTLPELGLPEDRDLRRESSGIDPAGSVILCKPLVSLLDSSKEEEYSSTIRANEHLTMAYNHLTTAHDTSILDCVGISNSSNICSSVIFSAPPTTLNVISGTDGGPSGDPLDPIVTEAEQKQ